MRVHNRGSRRKLRVASVAAMVSCASVMLGGAPALAGGTVDPSTLVPEPPPGATCRASGGGVICHTTFIASWRGPAFPLPCGLVYETRDEARRGIRWYDDGRLTRRFVFADDSGSWSLSPDGAGPAVTWVAEGNWQNVDIDAEASEETWPTTYHGMQFRLTGPDGKLIFQFSGLERPDGSHSGRGDWAELFESPEGQAAICEALTS